MKENNFTSFKHYLIILHYDISCKNLFRKLIYFTNDDYSGEKMPIIYVFEKYNFCMSVSLKIVLIYIHHLTNSKEYY